MGRKRDFVLYHLFISWLCFLAMIRFLFFFWKFQDTRKLLKKCCLSLLAFYASGRSSLNDFRTSRFYKKRESRLCWAEVSALNPTWGNVRPEEACILATLVSESAPKTIFEFGTLNGYSTVHLARNAPHGARVYTLDLPRDHRIMSPGQLTSHQAYDDIKAINKAREIKTGPLFSVPGYENVVQLYGDSMTFDLSEYYGKIDFCFIDACHSYAYVRKDTENAFKMVSPEGVIVWHDFNDAHHDVFRLLNEIAAERKLFRIEDTSLAVYFNNE